MQRQSSSVLFVVRRAGQERANQAEPEVEVSIFLGFGSSGGLPGVTDVDEAF